MEPEVSSEVSKKTATGTHPQLDESNIYHHTSILLL
jgi:hypothetical protein